MAPFSRPGFRELWFGSVLFYLALMGQQVATGWLVLDQTGSAFLTTLAFAVLVAPGVVMGPVAGSLADRYPRGRILVWSALASACFLGSTVLLVLLDRGAIAFLLPLLVLIGVALTLQTVAFGAIVPDLVEEDEVLAGTSVGRLGQIGVGIIGALAAGFLISWVGPEAAYGAAAAACFGATGVFILVPSPAVGGEASKATLFDLKSGLMPVLRLPLVAAVLAITAAVEIFGFSFLALLPVLAEETLEVGPEGLGGLTAATSAGAVAGTALLLRFGDSGRPGALLLGAMVMFGLLLMLLASSDVYVLSLAVVFVLSITAAAADTLEWVLLQAGTPPELRGRAFGAWSTVAGLGWLGPLAVGLLAGLWNVQAALALSGAALAFCGLAAVAVSKRLRSS